MLGGHRAHERVVPATTGGSACCSCSTETRSRLTTTQNALRMRQEESACAPRPDRCDPPADRKRAPVLPGRVPIAAEHDGAVAWLTRQFARVDSGAWEVCVHSVLLIAGGYLQPDLMLVAPLLAASSRPPRTAHRRLPGDRDLRRRGGDHAAARRRARGRRQRAARLTSRAGRVRAACVSVRDGRRCCPESAGYVLVACDQRVLDAYLAAPNPSAPTNRARSTDVTR